jgi:hypothetical protein
MLGAKKYFLILKISCNIFSKIFNFKGYLETQKMGLEIPETQESPEEMDVDEIIEEPNFSEQRLLESWEIVEAMVTQEPKIFEEYSIALHHVAYNQNSRKLLLEKVKMKNMKVFEKWKSKIDFLGKQSKELEKTLIPKPLVVEPLTTIQPTLTVEDVPETKSKLK